MRDAPSGFPLWILTLVIPALLLCGGSFALALYRLWGTPSTHPMGGPVAVVGQADGQAEMEARPDGAVRVDDILTDYADNGVVAARKYDGKPITVRGKAVRVERGGGLAVVYLYPVTGQRFFWAVCPPYVVCRFARIDDAAEFKKGDTMTVSGRCDGQPKTNRDGAVTLNDCKKK
jgi:hypothetical protein